MRRASVLTLALLILVLSNVEGQVYFDRLFGHVGAEGVVYNGTTDIEPGYLSLSYSYGFNLPYVFITDHDGGLLNEYQLVPIDSLSLLAVALLKLQDTSFVCLTGWTDLSSSGLGEMDFGVIRFNVGGELLSYGYYGHVERDEVPQNFIVCDNGNMILIGQAVIGSGQTEESDIYVVAMDAGGNQLWENSYGGPNYDSGKSLLQTPDSGFLLLGWTRSYGAGQRDFYLVKTDSVGNQEWQQTYGGGGGRYWREHYSIIGWELLAFWCLWGYRVFFWCGAKD